MSSIIIEGKVQMNLNRCFIYIMFSYYYIHWLTVFRVIAQSYPACNTIMLSGCVLSLSSIYLFGLDGQIISPNVFPNICQIKTWVLSIGFTLGYGAMYSKVWRVHRLHTSQKKNSIRV